MSKIHSNSSNDKENCRYSDSSSDSKRRRRRHSSGKRSPVKSDVVCLRKFKWHIIKGDKGDYGCRGSKGRKGSKGCKGSPGCKGSRGSRGKRGHRGSEGPQGCKGSRGRCGSRGKCGSKGCEGRKGSRGRRGKKGCDGRGGILGYSFATNTDVTSTVASGSSVVFNNTDFPSYGVTTNGTLFTLQHGGVYEFDYMVQGTSTDPSLVLQYSLVVNGSVVLFGSTFSSSASGPTQVMGSVLAQFPDVAHGVVTSEGTTIELKNMASNTLLSSTGSNNAYLKITKIA